MVLSYYLYKYPYKIIWHILKVIDKNPAAIVYCSEPTDYVIMAPVLKYLPSLPVFAKNRRTIKFLREKGIDCRRMPAFPGAVMMSRHAAHKFPEPKIFKIGFRHGAYHFKAFAKRQYYNAFDIYFVTSQREVELLKQRGVVSAVAIGFPKLDDAFNGTYNEKMLDMFHRKAKINVDKKTAIFTATWDGSGMSAIEKWIDSLQSFTDQYNILVTVHPWSSKKYIQKLQQAENIYFMNEPDVLPYLMISDVLVGDTSSIIAEFCALDKPIVTFKVPIAKRSTPEINQLLQNISIQIETVDQLKEAIDISLREPDAKSKQRQQANLMMFDRLDGNAGERAAAIIKELIHLGN